MRRSGAKLALSTRLTISRPSGNSEPRIVVRVDDNTSRSTIVELDVPLTEFAMALTGRAEVECSGKVYLAALARLGLVRENESRTLLLDAPTGLSEQAWRDLVDLAWHAQHPFDAEHGWAIFGLDQQPNPHRRGRTENGERTYQIAVERYVEPSS